MAVLRPTGDVRRELQAVAIALLASVAVGSLLMLALGVSPARIWWMMLASTATDSSQLGELLYRATALALCGLAVSVALDAGLFNIGGEGQLAAGVLACAVVGAELPAGTPAVVAIPLCVLAAALAGGAIGALIGGLRATRGAHEVITSIMLNQLVAGVTLWIGNRWLFEGGTTGGALVVPAARLPQLGLGGSAANASLLLALAAVAAVWWLRARTTWGIAVRAVGQDPSTARTAGYSIARVQILAMAAAGALAGLAAVNFVLGHKHAFEEGLGRGTGFLGIAAALLGRTHPVGVLLASLLLAFLATSGLEVAHEVPKELTEMLQGVVILSVAASSAWMLRQTPRGIVR